MIHLKICLDPRDQKAMTDESSKNEDSEAVLESGWNLARSALMDSGFNLMAIVDPQSMSKSMRQRLGSDQVSCGLLLAAGGRELFAAMGDAGAVTGEDPFDTYTIATVTRIFDDHLPTVKFNFEYPGEGAAPLIALGEYLGWSHPSPLGLGISPKFGLWFAYRAFVRIDARLPVTQPINSASPCDSCVTRECVAGCPAAAVSQPGKFAIDKCGEFRQQASSRCANTCLARLACPIATQHQYDSAQFSYHQGRALVGLKRWRSK